nr:hypothetical protein [Brachybacterium squillarum]
MSMVHSEQSDRRPGTGSPETEDDVATQRYLDLIRSAHREWGELERSGDASVQLSEQARSTIRESVRADVRHGAQVQMPPTASGPYTMSEYALRGLVRRAVDQVDGALALKARFEHDDSGRGLRERGLPTRVICRISASIECRDLQDLADRVRTSVREAFAEQVELRDPVVDIHIEDLHEQHVR